jgi:hypothetical protein
VSPDTVNFGLITLKTCCVIDIVIYSNHNLLLKTIYGFVSWNIAWFFKSKIRGVRSKFIFGTTLAFNGVGKMVYEDFLPYALADGSFVAAPEPVVVGKGLEFVQAGLDL